MEELKKVKSYLKRFGLSAQGSAVYIELFKVGPTTALKLAKTLGIPRTQVYRELEMLQEVALVSADKLRYGSLFRALPLENLEELLETRKASVETLSRELLPMAQMLQGIAAVSAVKATVRHYYGVAGLRQANWNLTKARKEFRVFETRHISQHLDAEFARRLRERIIERNLASFDLTNQKTVRRSDLEPVNLSKSNHRYIDPAVLDIKFEMYIYDETVTLLDYSKKQEMAIEICHPNLSLMMTQLFDAMWKMAKVIVPQ
jgi:sugar-specific transcriptional regulator TrmB